MRASARFQDWVVVGVLWCVMCLPSLAAAQSPPKVRALVQGAPIPEPQGQAPTPPASEGALPRLVPDAPPPPVAPEVVARDDAGHATVRAVRATSPIRVDGRLDEDVYSTQKPMSGFIQVDPRNGQPAGQQTEVWLLFDATNVYVSARVWESNLDRMVANELRRDNIAIYGNNDAVTFIFDTFYNRRDGTLFVVNAIGGRFDGQYTNERQYNTDFNPVWNVNTGRFEGGWTFEAAIPFKSLRYPQEGPQVWGFNVQRNNRWKNELSSLVLLPPARAANAVTQSSRAATMVGLDAPARSKNIELKPYATGNLTTDLTATPATSNDAGADAGVDVKFGISQGMTGDVTYNPDFAQVEADEQQVNLTRFNIFLPEKRDFFLENQTLFTTGMTGAVQQAGDTPILFYSRRIGIDQSREVPLDIGGRATGRVGKFGIGLIDIRSKEDSGAPSTNFSVIRIKRDVLRRSNIGALYTGRTPAQSRTGRNYMAGVDGAFSFFTDFTIATYYAQSKTEGREGSDQSYRAQLDYTGDRYGVQAERLVVEPNFNPEVGFVRRNNMRKSFGQFRFSPRPKNIRSVRKFSGTGSVNYIENAASGVLETRTLVGEFATEYQNGDRLSATYSNAYEFLPRPFPIAPPVVLPVGSYSFDNLAVGYSLGQQHTFSGNVSAEYGTFYNGHKTSVGLSRGRINFAPQFSIEPTVSLNWVDLVQGSFINQLIGSRITYSLSQRMFVSALVQYASASRTASTNVRLRWEYLLGSELFVVYNDQRLSTGSSFPELTNRALIVKVNRLFRF